MNELAAMSENHGDTFPGLSQFQQGYSLSLEIALLYQTNFTKVGLQFQLVKNTFPGGWVVSWISWKKNQLSQLSWSWAELGIIVLLVDKITDDSHPTMKVCFYRSC